VKSEVKHKDYILVPVSYEAETGYRPKVILRKEDGSSIHEEPLFWEKEFEDKNTADSFAIMQAKMYIDRNK
jgi:hypothetical protein